MDQKEREEMLRMHRAQARRREEMRRRKQLARKKRRIRRLLYGGTAAVLVVVVVMVVAILVNREPEAQPSPVSLVQVTTEAEPESGAAGGDGQEAAGTLAEGETAGEQGEAAASPTAAAGAVGRDLFISSSTQELVLSTDTFQEPPEFASTLISSGDSLLDTANRQAAMYDYDRAIATLQSAAGYESNASYTAAIANYEALKQQLVQWPDNSKITHVFFHTLIVDTSKAFNAQLVGENQMIGYNEAMTTVNEFCKMLQSFYEDGYVLVSLHDIAQMEVSEDGTETMVMQPIELPEGKTPMVLSVDDVCYYEYMTGDGFATKLVLDENGAVTNEYVLDDGSVIYGAYDALPILEEFIEAHPDFSYRGSKGILALTGYNGVFGYRTSDFWYREDCEYYEATESNEAEKAKYTTPNRNIDADKETATQVANAIKELGWELASHSWGHIRVQTVSYERMVWDTDMWEREVQPIVGDTDIIIFAFGEDLATWRGYEQSNEKFQYLKAAGFDYFCNVDGSQQYWVQTAHVDENIHNYFRMGRRNLDGTRMWEAIMSETDPSYTNRLSDLFDDVSTIFDPARPTPVE